MVLLKQTISLFTLVACLIGSGASQLVPKPQDDPFYQPPAGFESKDPGAILRTRKVETAFLGLIPNPVDAWQLLYRTTAINGSAIATVTTVFKPDNAKTDRFVSFHTAYDGAARDGICDPSYNYRLGAPRIDLIASVEYLLLQAFIADGNIVSSPDYEGPDSAFGAGRLSGTGVLDSMRAVVNFKSTLGFDNDNPAVVGQGYSGGGIATGWAASLQPKYAPELNIKGWASGGTPANLTGTAVYIDGTLFAGFVPQALVGLAAPSAYGAQFEPVLDEILTPTGDFALASTEQICGVESLLEFAFQEIESDKYQTLGKQLFYQPTIHEVLSDNIMGQTKDETPTAPVYLYHAPMDEVIPYSNASTLRDEWCGYGASVEFVTVQNGGHATTEVIGFAGAFEFVRNAFSGTTSKGCTSKTILNDTLDPLALGVTLEPILVDLLNGIAIAGRQDANIIKDIGNLNKTAT